MIQKDTLFDLIYVSNGLQALLQTLESSLSRQLTSQACFLSKCCSKKKVRKLHCFTWYFVFASILQLFQKALQQT